MKGMPLDFNPGEKFAYSMADALPDEVRYYSPPSSSINAMMVPSVFPGEGLVPLTYGGFHVEVSDASGAWISSTIDLLRLVSSIDGRATRPDVLSAARIGEMTSSGAPFPCGNGTCHYGAGWFVNPAQGDGNWWHGGSMPGATAMLVRTYNNMVWIGLFNGRTVTPTNSESELDATLWNARAGVTSFPTHDLFSTFR
jgi:N-acyl-D-amino-acid deacylase